MKIAKHIIKLLGITVLLVSFSSCGGSKANDSLYPFEEDPPFTLGEVYFQEWVAGVRGGGSGVNVHFTIEEYADEVKIKELYFRNKVVKIKRSPQNRDAFIGFFKTALNQDVVMDRDPAKEAENTPPEAFPFQLEKNEAVVSYVHNGETYFLVLDQMEEKPQLAYPKGNPNIEN